MRLTRIFLDKKPLEGVRVLECGQFIASGFAGTMLGYFGAEVIKIEPLTGDGIRTWRVLDNSGTSLWWYSIARNKKSVTLDIGKPEGAAVLKELAAKSDIMIENFKPGVMEKWGLGPESLKIVNPQLVYTRISGYGQTGPYSHKPGFASVCEGYGGLRYLTAEPVGSQDLVENDKPLYVRPNLSLGDSLASMHAVVGSLLGLRQREKGDGKGQVVDVSIVESVMNMMESVIPEADRTGADRMPAGTSLPGIVPSGTYACLNGGNVIIGANSEGLYKKLMETVGRRDLAYMPGGNAERAERQIEIDSAINAWTSTLEANEVRKILDQVGIPVGLLYSANEILADEHMNARNAFETVHTRGKGFKASSVASNAVATKLADAETTSLKIPAIHPKLNRTPGSTEWEGAALGAHNDEVLSKILGFSHEKIQKLRDTGIIGI